jgi:hypothetical protein
MKGLTHFLSYVAAAFEFKYGLVGVVKASDNSFLPVRHKYPCTSQQLHQFDATSTTEEFK